MVPLIERDVVEKSGWVGKDDFIDLLAVAQSAPGVFAVNMAVFIGYRLRGKRGALAASLGCVLPSVVIILLIALFFRSFRHNEVVNNIFLGIRPAVVALIWATGTTLLLKNIGLIGFTSIKPDLPSLIALVCVAAIYFLFKIVFKKKLSAIQVILISALLGIVICSIILP